MRTAVVEKGKSEDEGKDFPINALKAYRGSGGTAPVILNPKLDAGEWSAWHPSGFTPGERDLRCP